MLPLSFIAFLAVTLPIATYGAPITVPLAPVHRVERRAPSGGYIVKFKNGVVPTVNRRSWLESQLSKANCAPQTSDERNRMSMSWSQDVFDGFSGPLSSEAVNALRSSPDVDYIVEDGEAWTTELQTQTNAPWGLQRLSQQTPLTKTDDKATDFVYTFDDTAGAGVDIYIIDTGVQVSHPEFEGRATFDATFGSGTPNVDINGHGTHVAGIAASKTFGVAKKANIIAIKVMSDNGRGDTSNIINGINHAVVRHAQANPPRSSIINISIISNRTPALDDAVASAVSLGIHVVVGAGNDGADAGNFSPARSPVAVTVGATNIRDAKSSFSNIGAAVDIFAPGENILSTAPGSQTQTLSGTSMATPFVSGTVAYLLALEGATTPARMRAKLQALGTEGVITALPSGTINELAWNGAINVSTAPPATDSAGTNAQNNASNLAQQKQQVVVAVDGVVEVIKALSNAAARVGL